MSTCAGDWVEVKSKEEILATLDKEGRLEGMPFMPEMFEHCGKRMRVHNRAHKGCDTINPVSSRSLPNSVLLDGVRCSGAAHGGCEAQCTVFWKEAWLKTADHEAAAPAGAGAGCTESDVIAATQNGVSASGKQRYRCQATEFPNYTSPLRSHSVGQYVEDLASKNVGFGEFILTAASVVYNRVLQPQRRERKTARQFYNWFVKLWGGTPFPYFWGSESNKPDIAKLDLRPGELVRVKPVAEIVATLDADYCYKNLRFDAEMVPFCGGVYRVRSRVERFLNEKTGEMLKAKTPSIILENVWCLGRYSHARIFCPRAIYSWWREAWLERAPDAEAPTVATALGANVFLKDWPHDEETTTVSDSAPRAFSDQPTRT
ncbi:MAG: hypothetical protein ABUL73_02880 [Alphaproteobacteria bacterium]